jgi:hypothetical protein
MTANGSAEYEVCDSAAGPRPGSRAASTPSPRLPRPSVRRYHTLFWWATHTPRDHRAVMTVGGTTHMAGGAGRAGAAHGCPAYSDLETMLADPVHAAPGGSAHRPGGSDAPPRPLRVLPILRGAQWPLGSPPVVVRGGGGGAGGMLVGYGPVLMRWQ